MPMNYVCFNCKCPIRDGESFHFDKGFATHSSLDACMRRLADKVEAIALTDRANQHNIFAFERRPVHNLYEIKTGGPSDLYGSPDEDEK